jgi:hypothetical protein
MALKVIGAGLGRTGTKSLKTALERLTGEPCYHMLEIFGRPQDVPLWHEAIRTGRTEWDRIFDGYATAVDWPVGAFWSELLDVYPDAPVLLSTRTDPQTWWKSVDDTIANSVRQPPPPELEEWAAMTRDLINLRFADGAFAEDGKDVAIAAYEAHNAAVRATVPPERLVEYQPGDGWEPLARMLGVAAPDEPFPHENTTAEFREMVGLPPV